ncbi:MAG TPA: protein kinase [Steroidobacteraceae bacterium]
MSASIDNGAASTEDSRGLLASWLEDYIAGRCDRSKMHEQFLEVCRSNPEAPWDALALLDQYQRRGRVDVGVVRALKAEIAQLVFGVATQTEEPREGESSVDTTGTRWRKLQAERAAQAEPDTDEAPVPDPVTRALDPVTRPPLGTERRAAATAVRETSAASRARVGPGSVLRDRYELMEVIRRDRTGTVYQAFDRHRSHLPAPRCYVAIRVFELPQNDREAAIAALERQAYEAQSLSHPNIASVFDLDRHEDVYFAVMELIEGESLSDVLRRLAGKPLSRERAHAVLSTVGAALMHAHRLEIAHGDLKPASILLTTHGDVKVIGFGFARSHRLDQWVSGEPRVDGDAGETAAYASIERVGGEEPHPRDDVYSLACIAYEVLSGRHPYGGRSAPLARAHGRPPQKIAALNHRQWQALELALKWNREERRIDVEQLLDALGVRESSRVTGVPTATTSLDNPFGRGKGALLMTFFIVAAGAIAWWQWPRFIEAERASPVPAATESMPSPSEPSTDTLPTQPPPAETGASSSPEPPKPIADPAPAIPSTGEIVAATAEPSADESATPPQRAASEEPRATEPAIASVPPTIEFDKDTYVATEDEGMVRLTIRRQGSTRNPVRFRWVLRSNSAEAGADYAAIGPGVDVIPPGARNATIAIPLVVDAVPENTELFLVEIEALDEGVAIGGRAHAAVIIVDDD